MSEKKIAIVTGASRGIGKAIALELARQGIFVVINYNGSKEKAEEALRTIQNEGGDGVIYQCNVADFEACKTFIEDIVSTYGRIDILVNNAGITKDGLLMRMSEADFSEVVDINLKGTFHCIHHVARPMLKQKSGRMEHEEQDSFIVIRWPAGKRDLSKISIFSFEIFVRKKLTYMRLDWTRRKRRIASHPTSILTAEKS